MANLLIRIELPWPPALNNLYANTENGRVLRKPGKAYKWMVFDCCEKQDIQHVKGRLRVDIWAYPPDNRRRDIDGLFKIVLDSLQQAGVFEDDSHIDHLSIHRGMIRNPSGVVVAIEGEL